MQAGTDNAQLCKPVTLEEIAAEYAWATRSLTDSLRHYHTCGVLLNEKKASITHGEWLEWLQKNEAALGFAERTARRMMDFANRTLASDLDHQETLTLSRELWGHTDTTAHVSHNTGESEWFTPTEYVEAARRVMGRIDLDPASTEEANTIVKAECFYCLEDNGLAHEWHGCIWLNPPYAQPAIEQFCTKVAEEFSAGRIEAACVLINNATETKFFQSLARISTAICFPAGRIRFWHPEKESATPLQGQAVIYLGSSPKLFIHAFKPFGFVVT